MRQPLLGIFACVFFLISSLSLQGQTTLSPGDIAVTGYNADGTDNYMVVLLAPVTSGTVISFTDNAWDGSMLLSNEGTHTLTFTSAAPAGTEIEITGSAVTFSNTSTGSVTTMGSLNFAGTGDVLLVYQGAAASPTFITALNMNGAWNTTLGNNSTSVLPPGLTDGVNAFTPSPEVDNALYDRSTTTGSAAAILASIYTNTNWNSTSNTVAQTLVPQDYTVSPTTTITPADMPTLAGDMNICLGASANIMVTAGNLNDATDWVIYTGSCGGTEIDRNPTGMFTVTPTATTTYFVGGESSAGVGPCSMFTVTIITDNTPPTVVAPANVTTTSTMTDESVTGSPTITDDCSTATLPNPFFSEIHYDDMGADSGEGAEIIAPAGTDLSGWSIVAYNGSSSQLSPYQTVGLSGVVADQGSGFGAVWTAISGLQNGAPDGLALVDNNGVVVQFISYEGSFTAASGPAAGMTSMDIGAVESNGGTADGTSIQLQGSGNGGTWVAGLTASPNAINPGLSVTGNFISTVVTETTSTGACAGEIQITRTWTATDAAGNSGSDSQIITVQDNEPPVILAPGDITILCTQTDFSPAATGGIATAYDPGVGPQPVITPFINELHYDNSGADINEFVEVAGLAGADMTGYSVVLYNGSNGNPYSTLPLTGTLMNASSGFGFTSVVLPQNGLQNGAPDGLALVDPSGSVLEFLSYEGAMTAASGPAAGMMSTDIGVAETPGTIGLSLQRTGAGAGGSDFTWTGPVAESPGMINAGQSTTVVGPLATTFTEVISADGLTITRTFSATDDCGNTTTVGDYVQVITIGPTPPVIECRQPTVTCNAPGLCGNDQIDPLPPFTFDPCDSGTSFTFSSDAPSVYPIGTTIVTWTVTNDDAQTSTCQTEVIITDEEAPSINCGSGNLSILIQDPDLCFGTAFINPLVTDNCGLLNVSGTGVYNFQPGIHTQTVTATDINGLTASCEYTIYVHDDVKPTPLFCPDDITVASPLELTPIGIPQPFFTDNCGIISVTNDAPTMGYPQGTTTVTFTATDPYGQEGVCAFNVNIVSGLNVTEMPDISASLTDSNEARVAWNEPNGFTGCAICLETEINNYRYLGTYSGHQYFIYEGENATWSNAENMAEILAGQLVSINSMGENRFLKAALNEDTPDAWMGLNAYTNAEESELTWVNEDEVNFLNFTEDYSANENEIAGVLQADGSWTLANPNTEKTFIVERPCINFEQISPVLVDADDEATLLTCGSQFPEGTYEVTYRATDMCGETTDYTFNVNVQEPDAQICQTGGKTDQVWIDNILIGEYEQATGDDNGFGDYSQDEMILYAAIDQNTGEWASIPVSISAGGNTTGEELFYRIWLDINQDGDFFDSDELIAEGMSTGDWNVELPAFSQEIEMTQMRVMVSKFNYPEVCGEVQQGEAEDYRVKILETHVRPGATSDDIDNTSVAAQAERAGITPTSGLAVYPNPTQDRVFVNLKDFAGQDVVLTLSNQLGQVTQTQELVNVVDDRFILNVKSQAEGVYLLTLYSETGAMQTTKLIIKR